jgi:redox-sensitive bicupin YhaK (pirin superfamily)
LQIWIEPNTQEVEPSYEQKTVPLTDKQGKLCLIASQNGQNHSVKIHADANLYAGLFEGTQTAELDLDPKRKAYIHLIRGSLKINGQEISGGDALLIDNESKVSISEGKNAEVLVFDLSA